LKAISLFTGAGGLDLGLEAAEFEIAVAVEPSPGAVKTLSQRESWRCVPRAIEEVSSEQILEEGDLQEGEAALLTAGPPCQPFSKSGYWVNGDTRRLDDPRASTIEHFLRVLRDTLPEAFLFENVHGFVYENKKEALDLFQRTIDAINKDRKVTYSARTMVLNAADFGVPQDRKRLFIIGHREGTEFGPPAPTHQRTPAGECEPVRNAWDAIGDLEEDCDPRLQVTGKWSGLLPSIPEGGNYLYHTPQGEGQPLFGWRRRYWSFLLKLAKNSPSWTITAQPGSATGPFHWKNRRLSIREMARLQTFPDDFEILGSFTSARQQLGNAVPSALAEMLGLEIRKQLLGDETAVDMTASLVPDRRLPVPDPEPVSTVPEWYAQYIGDHPPHPGEGKGPGATGHSRPS
jgi:DNA (cytosine-5)-methyltransferase 1